MKILVINSTNYSLKDSLLEFVISKQNFSSIFILEKISGKTNIDSLMMKLNSHKEVLLSATDFLDKEKLTNILLRYFQGITDVFKVVFVEDLSIEYNGEFAQFDISGFRKTFLHLLEEKISLFQVLLSIIKQNNLSTQILILVPEYSQTTVIGENVPQSISFSASHMVTTAIADESIDFGLYCNAILETDSYIDTLDYLLFESDNKTHGKLFKDKKIVQW